MFPNLGVDPPSLAGRRQSWYSAWLDLPDAERGHMRTYTVREMRGTGRDTPIVVDFVLHSIRRHRTGLVLGGDGGLGDRIILVGPRRGSAFGGIEFCPGPAGRLLLAGDDSGRSRHRRPILVRPGRTMPVGRPFSRCRAPGQDGPDGARRNRRALAAAQRPAGTGIPQIAAVRAHLGLPPTIVPGQDQPVDPDLWETPTFSSSGEDITERSADRNRGEP